MESERLNRRAQFCDVNPRAHAPQLNLEQPAS
jgi:hypothetical protein